MNPFTPKPMPVPKPKSVVLPHIKPIQLPKLPPLCGCTKPVLSVGGLPGGAQSFFGKPSSGPLSNAASKAVPSIEQQLAAHQRQRMIDIRRVQAAEKADKQAQVSSRRGLS